MRKFRITKGSRKDRSTRHPIFGGPQPLILGDQKLVLSWSAKSGSVQILLWYLIQIQLLDDAKAYNPWPHNFRTDILPTNDANQAWVQRFIAEGAANYTLVKFMRDPMQRCVSSYRHALRSGYADAEMELILDQPINHRLGFSFHQYLEYLSSIDLGTADLHHKLQRNSIDLEKFGKEVLIYVERTGLYTALNLLEKKYHLRQTNFAEFDEFKFWAKAHHAKNTLQEIPQDTIIDRRITKLDADNRWPKELLLRCDPAREWVRDIYRADYVAARRLEPCLLIPPEDRWDGELSPSTRISNRLASIRAPLQRYIRRRKQKITRLGDAARVAVHLAPSTSIYHFHRANEMVRAGRHQVAESELRRAIEMDPVKVEYWFRLSEIYTLLKRFGEAVDAARAGLKLVPGNALFHFHLGMLHVRKLEFENALAEQRKAIELEPGQYQFHFRTAQSLNALQRVKDAASEVRIAVSLDPKSAMLHNFLGKLLLKTKQYPEALTEIRTAVRLSPNRAEFHRSLSQALGLIGRNDEAVDAAKQAVDLLPGDLDLQANLEKLQKNI